MDDLLEPRSLEQIKKEWMDWGKWEIDLLQFKIKVLFFNGGQILLSSFKNYFSLHKTQTLWSVNGGGIPA
jgi:hypothetical protein